MIQKIKEKHVKLSLLLFFIIFAILIPYVHDDWGWGSSIGMNLFKTGFSNYNGRYISNVLVLILTRSKIAKVLIFSITSYLLLVLINSFLKLKDNYLYYISLSLIILMPPLTLNQGYVWISGFVNYTMSMLPILLYLYFNRDMFDNIFCKDNLLSIIGLLFLGIISSLSVEHVTLFNLILSLFVFIFAKIKTNKFSKSNFAYFIGSVLGTIVMFSNKAYYSVLDKTDNYRTIVENNFFKEIISKANSMIAPYLIYKNVALLFLITILLITIGYNYFKKNKIKRKTNYFILFYQVLFLIYILILVVNPKWQILSHYTKTFNTLISIIWFFSLIFFIINFVNENRKYRMLFILLGIAIMTCPLFVVNPVGPRCFVPMYFMWIVFTLDMLDYAIVNKFINIKLLHFILGPIALASITYIFSIYIYIYKFNIIRERIIDNYSDKNYICLPKLPYNNVYLHCGDPINDFFIYKFKKFYKIDEQVKIEFDSLKNCKIKNKQND